jgi:cell division protein FtsL
VISRPAIAGNAVNARARSRCQERGGARIKTVIWLVIFVAFMYVSIEVVPVLFAEYEFQDDIQTTARYVPYNRATMDEVKASVLKSAQSHDLPVTPADITVVPHGYGAQIDVTYSVTVNLLVYQWTFNFHPSAASTTLT